MPNEVQLIVGAATDVGKEREANEDSYGLLHCAAGDLLTVCDGMGGHVGGQLASRTARDAIALHVAQHGAAMHPRELLRQAAIAAHEAVRQVAAQSAQHGMGTTCVMVLVQGRQAWVCNVGDSRAYLVRGGAYTQLTVDHTKARKLLDAGLISGEMFANHPEKGVLAQALGQRATPEPYVSEAMALGFDDYFVLCSDGVYDSTESDLIALTAAKNPNYAAHDLVVKAVERDGKDNATVVIGRVVDLNAAAAGSGLKAPSPRVVAAVAPAPGWWQTRNVQLAISGALVLGGVVGAMLVGLVRSPDAAPPPASPDPQNKTADGNGGAANPPPVQPEQPDVQTNTAVVADAGPANDAEVSHKNPDAGAEGARQGTNRADAHAVGAQAAPEKKNEQAKPSAPANAQPAPAAANQRPPSVPTAPQQSPPPPNQLPDRPATEKAPEETPRPVPVSPKPSEEPEKDGGAK